MTASYRIREAECADTKILVAFAEREAIETEGSAPDGAAVDVGVRSAIEGFAPATYWVAESDGGSVVASISVVTEWSNFRGGYYWWVQSLYIDPQHRGSGLVDRLLDFVAEAARAAGALDLRLYVLRSNDRAMAAYRRCRFEAAPYAIMVRRLGDP